MKVNFIMSIDSVFISFESICLLNENEYECNNYVT